MQAAVDAAAPGEQIWVAEGTYRAPISGAPVVELDEGTTLFGGFAGTEDTLEARSGSTRATVLDGDFLGDDQTISGGVTDNSAHVVDGFGDTDVTIDGFRIIRGHLGEAGFPNNMGAGVRLAGSSDGFVLRNLWLEFNDATGSNSFAALGLHANTSGLIEHVIFRFNSSVDETPGLYINASNSSPTVTARHLTFFQNDTADTSGSIGQIAIHSGAALDLAFASFANNSTNAFSAGSNTLLTASHIAEFSDGAIGAGVNDPEVTADHVCSDRDWSSKATNSILLDGSTPELSNPFSLTVDGQLALRQTSGGNAATSACVDAGDEATALALDPDFSNLSTSLGNTPDGGAPDYGAHYQELAEVD